MRAKPTFLALAAALSVLVCIRGWSAEAPQKPPGSPAAPPAPAPASSQPAITGRLPRIAWLFFHDDGAAYRVAIPPGDPANGHPPQVELRGGRPLVTPPPTTAPPTQESVYVEMGGIALSPSGRYLFALVTVHGPFATSQTSLVGTSLRGPALKSWVHPVGGDDATLPIFSSDETRMVNIRLCCYEHGVDWGMGELRPSTVVTNLEAPREYSAFRENSSGGRSANGVWGDTWNALKPQWIAGTHLLLVNSGTPAGLFLVSADNGRAYRVPAAPPNVLDSVPGRMAWWSAARHTLSLSTLSPRALAATPACARQLFHASRPYTLPGENQWLKLSPDGRQIAVVQEVGDTTQLAVLQVDSGTVQLLGPATRWIRNMDRFGGDWTIQGCEWSHDGRYLVMVGAGEIDAVPVDPEKAVPLRKAQWDNPAPARAIPLLKFTAAPFPPGPIPAPDFQWLEASGP